MSMSEEKNPIPFGEPMDYPVLDKISAPEDLRKLPESSLPELARELRHFIVDSVSKTGGHLSSSLGAVELAIALHYVFNTPYDRIVWDVGHQAYAHKILTGRREGMAKLRQLGGISGFPKCSESEYDAFGTAHSSTSISAALGMAVAAHLAGERDRWAIAVIGDGALTGGMAIEALNDGGGLEKGGKAPGNRQRQRLLHFAAGGCAFQKSSQDRFDESLQLRPRDQQARAQARAASLGSG